MESEIIVQRGGGDLGSGVAYRLCRSGFRMVILEIEQPLVIRRTVSFAQAVIEGKASVEGITAILVTGIEEVRQAWQRGFLPVMIDPEMRINAELKPEVIIDATLAKRENGLRCGMAPLTIALGPYFEAGNHADVVIETNRGHNLGRLILDGTAEPNTGKPAVVNGHGVERVLRAPCEGRVHHIHDIGAAVRGGEVICFVSDRPVLAPFDGVVRGLIMNGMSVSRGLKIGDVDPRSSQAFCYTISDKARALGGSVLEAILCFRNRARVWGSEKQGAKSACG